MDRHSVAGSESVFRFEGRLLLEVPAMRLAILGSLTGNYSLELLQAAQRVPGITATLHEFSELQSSIGAQGWNCTAADGTELTAVDAVLVRTMPRGSLEQIIFRIDLLHRLRDAGVSVLNSPRCLEFAIDKYLTTGRLHAVGLPVPETVVCQEVDQAMAAFERLGGDVVLKPLFGGEGRGLMRLEDPELASRAFRTLVQLGAVLYLQRFVRHRGFDLRVLLLGDQAWSIRRVHPTDWRTNVSRGAVAEAVDTEPACLELARRSAAAVDGWFVGVDLLFDEADRPLVLEVNAVPGWQGLAAAHRVDMGQQVVAAVLQSIGER